MSTPTTEGDIVLDFHLGSGTTAAVAHKMRRRYIGVEQMDYVDTLAVERLKKVIVGDQGGISKSVNWQGGGDFIYCELMPYNQIFMDRIQSAESIEKLFDIWEEISSESFSELVRQPCSPRRSNKRFHRHQRP